jgi:hypothetical protein
MEIPDALAYRINLLAAAAVAFEDRELFVNPTGCRCSSAGNMAATP